MSVHDALLLDLDGTLYHGGAAVPGAVETVAAAQRQGLAVRYVTNNASRLPSDVAGHLRELGYGVEDGQVSTSAQAASAMLARRLPAGSPVLVVGTDALREEVRNAGFTVVHDATRHPAAVVQGHSPDTCWSHLAEACLALRAGAVWVACNADPTLPAERGALPGNGAMVAALRTATGLSPEFAGKPEPPLFWRAAESAGGRNPLVVGDRLDTDIAGAVGAGMTTLCVLSGVTTPAEVLAAPVGSRPEHIGEDVRAVGTSVASTAVAEQPDWHVVRDGSTVRLATVAADHGGAVSALRALCAVWWRCGSAPVTVRAQDPQAQAVLGELGFDAEVL